MRQAQGVGEWCVESPAAENMAARVDFELCLPGSGKELIGLADFVERSVADMHRKTAGRAFLFAEFEDQGAGGDAGEDVGEIEVLFEAGEVPARAVTLLHVVHGGEPTAAAGKFHPLIQGANIHGSFASERKPDNREPIRVDLGTSDQDIEAPERVPGAFAHQSPVGLLEGMLADIGCDDDIAHFGQGPPIPVQAATADDVLACAAVTVKREHGADGGGLVRGDCQPGLGTTPGSGFKAELFEPVWAAGRLVAPQDLDGERNRLRPLTAHHETEQHFTGIALPFARGGKVGGGKLPRADRRGVSDRRPGERQAEEEGNPGPGKGGLSSRKAWPAAGRSHWPHGLPRLARGDNHESGPWVPPCLGAYRSLRFVPHQPSTLAFNFRRTTSQVGRIEGPLNRVTGS